MLNKEGYKQETKTQKSRHILVVPPVTLDAVTISMHRPWAKLLMCGQILETCKCGAIHLHSASVTHCDVQKAEKTMQCHIVRRFFGL